MHHKVYQDTLEFWDEASSFLKQREAENSLSVGLSYYFKNDPTNCVYQSAVFVGQECVGTLVVSQHLMDYNFLPSSVSDLKVAQTLFDEFCKSGIRINGIVAEQKTADVYRLMFEAQGAKFKCSMRQGIYSCSTVKVPVGLTPQYALSVQQTQFRVATEKDIPTLAAWIEDFHQEAVPHDSPIDGWEAAQARVSNGMIYVLEKNQELVSMASKSRDIETSCSVNLVFTPKALRGQGYGSIVTARLTELALAEGKRQACLYTDLSNPTSNKIYQNIGYQFVCESCHYMVEAWG